VWFAGFHLTLVFWIFKHFAGGDAVPLSRPKATISHRFSSLRFGKAVKSFNPTQ
jgi:hypothetical protein